MEEVYQTTLKKYREKNEDWKNVSVPSESSSVQRLTQTSLNSYVPYPETSDPIFNHKISKKKEFRKNRYEIPVKPFEQLVTEKCSQGNFVLTENQRFLKQFISPHTKYNSVLLFHSVGTGKTCTAISIAEQFGRVFKKKHLVVVSPNLKSNFKKQIFDETKILMTTGREAISNQCTGMTYIDLIPDIHSLDKSTLTRRVGQLIAEKYQFRGYTELSNDFDKDYKKVFGATSSSSTMVRAEKQDKIFDALLKEKYSDRVIIIDEVHNLRVSQSSSGQKQLPEKLERILRVAHNVKLVLLTATPMFNDATEIVWILNLMLLNDKLPTINVADIFDANGNLTENGRDIIIMASRGRISHLKGENPYTFPLRLYPQTLKDPSALTTTDLPNTDLFGRRIENADILLAKGLPIVKSVMGPYQKAVYDKVEKMFKQEETTISNVETTLHADQEVGDEVQSPSPRRSDKTNRAKPDIQMALQVSNIVYPHPNDDVKNVDIREFYGQGRAHGNIIRGFNRCFDEHHSSYSHSYFSYKNDIPHFLSYGEVGKYSCKIKSILDSIKSATGIIFVYSSFLYSGLIPLAMAMEHIGFSRYGGGGNLLRNIKASPEKRGSYIILSANSKISSNNEQEILMAKHSSNKDGSVIKVILGSSIATEGIDFKNIREIHMMEPWYHLQRQEQVIGRGCRNCSHEQLPPTQRNVSIFQHVSMKKSPKRDGVTVVKEVRKESMDLRICRIAINKQEKINMVAKLLAANAVDCALNWNTNHHNIDKTLTVETSQNTILKNVSLKILSDSTQDLHNSCLGISNPNNTREIDDSTFDPSIHMTDIITPIIQEIKKFYERSPKTYYATFKDLFDKLTVGDEENLAYALDTMLKKKVVMTKNEPRQQGYLIYRGNLYLWQPISRENTKIRNQDRMHGLDTDYTTILNFNKFITRPNKKESNVSFIIDKLHKNKDILYKKLNSFRNSTNGREEEEKIACLDYVVDRMTLKEIITILKYFETTTQNTSSLQVKEKDVLESFKRAHMFYNKGGVYIFRNIYEKESQTTGKNSDNLVFISGGNEVDTQELVVKPLMSGQKEIEEKETRLKKNLVDEKKANIVGFVSIEKDGVAFKVIARKSEDASPPKRQSTGSTCEKNNKLQINMIKSIVAEVQPNYLKENINPIKKDMCEVLEIILRIFGRDKFARPYEYFLIKKELFSKKLT